MKILIIEDDKILGSSLLEYLSNEKMEVTLLSDDREIDKFFNYEYFDVILLDLMLNVRKGETILSYIKQKNPSIPVIIITAKGGIETKEECFNKGADDYIVKPFDPKELLLRIKSVGKRHGCFKKIIKIGNVCIDMETQTLIADDKEINLTKKEWDILYILLINRNKIVTSERIINYVWGDKPVGTESIRTYIRHIRKYLPEDSIKTYKGRGYMLISE